MRQANHYMVQPGWALVLRDMGISPTEVLKRAQLPEDLFRRQEASLSPAQYFRLWEAMEQTVGAEELPLKLGQAISAEAFDPPLFAAFCSPNMNVALQRLAQYKRLICPTILELEINEQQTRISLDYNGNEDQLPASMSLSELVFFTQLVRMATRERLEPLSLQLPTPPADCTAYDRYFGRRIRKGSKVSITFSARDARRPFLTENENMWKVFEPELRQRLRELDQGASMSERVRGVLLELIPAGITQIDAVAERLAVSRRTLQRRLGEEKTSFQEQLNQTRQQLADHYLHNSRLSLGEISFLLGFQDGNSFIRAFRGWTGRTPGEYRQATH